MLDSRLALAAAASRPAWTRRATSVGVPGRASDAIEVRDVQSGLALRASLIGARPVLAAKLQGRDTTFDAPLGPDTRMLVRRGPAGAEDFVAFMRKPRDERLVYRVELTRGAGARFVGRTFELLDATGAPRLRMAPPWLLDARGRTLDVGVAVRGCAVDTDPRAPFRRPIVPARRACEVTLSWGAVGAEYPLVIDPTWSATDSLATPRSEMAIGYLATPNVVVVAGGNSANDALSPVPTSSVELYDPVSETFAAGAPQPTATFRSMFEVLDDDTLLVAGGATAGSPPPATTWTGTYSGAAGTWTVRASMPTPRVWGGSAHLADGRVLVAAGKNTNYWANETTTTADIYDPATDVWATTGSLAVARYGTFIMQGLADGRVLLAGGFTSVDDLTLDDSEVYAPGSGTWSATSPMTMSRATGIFARLPSGDVVVAGGNSHPTTGVAAVPTATSEVFHPATNTWRVVGMLSGPIGYRATGAVSRADDTVVWPGGVGALGRYEQVYDARTETWGESCDPTRVFHVDFGTAAMPTGRILVAGGRDSTGVLATAWLSSEGRLTCDDGDKCTDDACDPTLGCTSVPNTATCDDGDPCTSDDVCAADVCAGTAIPMCGVDAGLGDAGSAADAGGGALDSGLGPADAGGGADSGALADAGNTGDGAAGAIDAGGGSGTTADDGGCGCRVAAPVGGSAPFAFAAAGALAWLLGRARRARRRRSRASNFT